MRPLTRVLQETQLLTLRAARYSQALAIACVDRLGGAGESGRPRPLGRLWRLQLDLTGALVGDPGQLLDEYYGHLQRLIALHGEFAARVLEAIDSREVLALGEPDASNVIPMPSRLGT